MRRLLVLVFLSALLCSLTALGTRRENSPPIIVGVEDPALASDSSSESSLGPLPRLTRQHAEPHTPTFRQSPTIPYRYATARRFITLDGYPIDTILRESVRLGFDEVIGDYWETVSQTRDLSDDDDSFAQLNDMDVRVTEIGQRLPSSSLPRDLWDHYIRQIDVPFIDSYGGIRRETVIVSARPNNGVIWRTKVEELPSGPLEDSIDTIQRLRASLKNTVAQFSSPSL